MRSGDRTKKRKARTQDRSGGKLEHENRLLRMLIDDLPDRIYVKDTQSRFVLANLAVSQLLGVSLGKVIGRTDFDFFPEDLASKFNEDEQKVFQSGQPVINQEEQGVDSLGNHKWSSVTKVPLRDDDGKIIGLVGMNRDITDKKRMEVSLKEAAEKFQQMFENVFDGISIFEESPDPDQRRLVDCNSRYAEMAGRSREELLRIGNIKGLSRPISRDRESLIDQGKAIHGTFTWLRPDGKDNVIEFSAVPIKMQGRTFTIGIDRDVTERKHAEAELRRLNRSLKTISSCNRVLVSAKDESELLQQICRILVDAGGYRFAWVGFADQDNEGSVRLVARAGCETIHLDQPMVARADEEDDGSPTAVAIRTGKTRTMKNAASVPWHPQINECGYEAFVALPLKSRDTCFGALNIYATDPNAFDREEVAVLEELAADLAYGIAALRSQAERSRAERALFESELRFRLLYQSAPIGIATLNPDGVFERCNPALERILGYTEQELSRLGFADITHPDDRTMGLDLVREISAGTRDTFDLEKRYVRKDGVAIWVKLRVSAIRDRATGELQRTVAMMEDITRQKHAEIRLRETLDLNRHVVTSSMLGIIIYDAETGQCILANEAAAESVGASVEQLLSQNFRELLSWKESGLLASAESVLATGGNKRTTVELHTTFGKNIWLECFLASFSSDQKPHLLLMFDDVTERLKADEALKRSEEKFRDLFDSAPVGYHELDAQGHVVNVNRTEIEMLGYRPEEMLGRPMWEFVRDHEAARERILAKLAGTRPTDRNAERSFVKKDGSTVPVLSDERVLRNNQGEISGMRTILQDITERKLADESMKKLLQAIEQTDEVVFMTDLKGTITYVNPAFERIYGFERSEAIGKTPRILKSGMLSSTDYEDFWSLLLSGRNIRGEIMNKTKRGTLVTIHSSVNPVFSEGKLIGFIAVQEDVTHRRRADEERKSLETQLFQAQKLESLGTLAGGIAHDFNNILGIILGHATMLEMPNRSPEKVSLSVEAISKAVRRGADLVRQILTFARKAAVLFEPVRVNDVVRDLEKMLQGTFPKTIELSLSLEKGLPFIDADRTQLHQTLLNLCVNARDAMPDGGTISISSSRISGVKLSERIPNAGTGEFVHLAVTDTGTGMDESIKQHIFEPFFTTKEKGKGTGLGLATSFGIVKSHHGYIDVDSAVGKGTTFHLYFPIPGRYVSPEETNVRKDDAAPCGGHEAVLFVEDEDMLREIVRTDLQAQGYTVYTASDGEEGIQLYRDQRDDIALVILDLGLPRVSGEQVLLRLKEINPDVRVMVATGYLDPDAMLGLMKAGAREFVQKPYQSAEILRKIRHVLDHGGVGSETQGTMNDDDSQV